MDIILQEQTRNIFRRSRFRDGGLISVIIECIMVTALGHDDGM